MAKSKLEYVPWLPKAKVSDLFPYAYKLELIEDIDTLKQVLSNQFDYMSFDTETTGLNQEEIDIVGYSICFDGITSYYIPVWHFNFGLGEEALDLIYERMCKCKTVFMFNMRYDVRVMEYHGYTTLYKDIVESGLSEEEIYKKKLELTKKAFIKYDMTKVNSFDVQALVYLVDTNIKFPSLKSSEEWYLGWRGASFEQTVSKAQNENAIKLDRDGNIKSMNFFYLTPQEAYEYAAVDALGTFLLALKLMPFYYEAKFSGELDIKCLMPLTRFENELTAIDTGLLKTYSVYLDNKIKEVQHRCWNTARKRI